MSTIQEIVLLLMNTNYEHVLTVTGISSSTRTRAAYTQANSALLDIIVLIKFLFFYLIKV